MIFAMVFVIAGCSEKENDGNSENSGDKIAHELPELAGEQGEWEFYNARAQYFIISMANGDFNAAYDMFDNDMKQAISVSSLKNDVWNNVIKQAGLFENYNNTENVTYEEYFICYVTSKHETSGVTLQVVFSEDGLISGLFIHDYPQIDGG